MRNAVPVAIPSDAKGTYALLLSLRSPLLLRAGSLDEVRLAPGSYLYCGSAMGGLAARVCRHLRSHKKLHWHIDYLTASVTPEEVWWARCPERAECRWMEAALGLPGAAVPAPGFGSSDCRCRSHLVYVPERPSAAAFALQLGRDRGAAVRVLRPGRASA